MNFKVDVCIVGAGPGGALLGYLLAKNNISTIVIERHEGIDKEFRGEHLNQEGEAILRTYGLYEKVEREGLLLMESLEYWQHGKVFKTITPADGERHVGIHIPQKNLLSVLLHASEIFPHYKLLTGTRVTELMTDENGVVIGIKAKKREQQVSIQSSIVVGADGRFSTVRKLANIPFSIIKHGYDLLWAKIPAPGGWAPKIRQALVNDRQLSLFTQAGGYVQIGWNIEEGSYPALQKESFEPFVRQLVEASPELYESVSHHIQSWKDFVLLNVFSTKCDTWVKDGVVIMGDAAHTMSPTGAFGINASLADAQMLSRVIMEALYERDVTSTQLKKFEQLRREAVEVLQKQQLIKEATSKEQFGVFVSS